MGCHPSHWRTHIFQSGGWDHQTSTELLCVQNPMSVVWVWLKMGAEGAIAAIINFHERYYEKRRDIWVTLFSDTMTKPNNREVKSQKHQSHLTTKETRRAPEGCC